MTARGQWYITAYKAFPEQKGAVDPEVPENGPIVGLYGSYLWARSMPEARRIAKARGIGERVDGTVGRAWPYEPPSKMLRRRNLTPKQRLNVIHAATFLAYLVMKARKTPVHWVLGDQGFLHELVHCLSHGWPRRKNMIEMLEFFESGVPGYLPPRGAKLSVRKRVKLA